MAEDEFAPVTPGEMLKEEFLMECGLSQSQLAKALDHERDGAFDHSKPIHVYSGSRSSRKPRPNTSLNTSPSRSKLVPCLGLATLPGPAHDPTPARSSPSIHLRGSW